MAVGIGRACPGVVPRTGALIGALTALFFSGCLIVSGILAMVYTYRESLQKVDRRTEEVKEMIQCYFGAGFAIWGVWAMLTIVMIFGIFVENKRALGFWLIFTCIIIPLYFVGGLIFLLVTTTIRGWIGSYLAVQGLNILALLWICLAIWVYFAEIRRRDKNPELRVDDFVKRKENEMMFAQPFSGLMPPAGSYNPGYGAPSGGSMSSIPRSMKSRQTYAPTEAGESVRAASTAPRQSRLDQYRAQNVEKDPIKLNDRSRSRSGEREGGTSYYRYQYTTDQKDGGGNYQNNQRDDYKGSQGSLGGRPAPATYQPANYRPPSYHSARNYQRPQNGQSQGSLAGREQPYQPQHHASQGSLGGRQGYQHHASQGSLGGRQGYQPRSIHASQGSLGGRPQYQLQAQDNQHSKDSEV